MSKMNPAYLWKDEIVWELYVKGIQTDPNSKVNTLKSLLRQLLKAEKDDSIVPHPAIPMDFQQETETCQRKLLIFKELVNIFNSDKRHIDYKRVMSRLLHVKRRLEYISPNNPEEENFKTELLNQTTLLINNLKLKAQNNDINLLHLKDTDESSSETSPESDVETQCVNSRRVSFATTEQGVNTGDNPNVIIHSDVLVRGPTKETLAPNFVHQNLNNNNESLNYNQFESSDQLTHSRTSQQATLFNRNTQENTNLNTQHSNLNSLPQSSRMGPDFYNNQSQLDSLDRFSHIATLGDSPYNINGSLDREDIGFMSANQVNHRSSSYILQRQPSLVQDPILSQANLHNVNTIRRNFNRNNSFAQDPILPQANLRNVNITQRNFNGSLFAQDPILPQANLHNINGSQSNLNRNSSFIPGPQPNITTSLPHPGNYCFPNSGIFNSMASSLNLNVPPPFNQQSNNDPYLTSVLNNQLPTNLINNLDNYRLPPLNRLNLKFNGKNQSLHSFLEKVEEFCLAYKIPRDGLLNFSHELFEGDVLIWYRSIRRLVNTWDELVYQLRLNFLPIDYELALWDEIRSRTQGIAERALIYIAVMENLFRRYINPVDENVQLKIIIRNLLPYYQGQLALRQPASLFELKSLCRILEDTKLRTDKFQAPPFCNSSTLEPELAYRKPFQKYYNNNNNRNVSELNQYSTSDTSNVNLEQNKNNPSQNLSQCDNSTNNLMNFQELNLSAINQTNKSAGTPQHILRKKVKCYNCDEEGHIFPDCKKKRNIFCFKCGQKNVTKPNCKTCSPKNLETPSH